MLDSPISADPAVASDLSCTRLRALLLSGDLAPVAVRPHAALAQTIGISTTLELRAGPGARPADRSAGPDRRR